MIVKEKIGGLFFDLIQGDCLEEMHNIKSYSIDFILTDLPYGTTACSWDEIIPFEPMWKEFYRILRPNGFIALTASQPFTTKLIASNIDNFSHQWIWQKEQGSNPLLANKMPMKNFEDVLLFSNKNTKNEIDSQNEIRDYFLEERQKTNLTYKQINEECFGTASNGGGMASNILTAYKKGWTFPTKEKYEALQKIGICIKDYNELKMKADCIRDEYLRLEDEKYPRVYNPQMTEGKEYVSGGGYVKHLDQFIEGGNVSNKRYPTSIIEFATGKSKSVHPTQKPTALLEYLIKTYTDKGMIVFDATMGSGSTGVACKNTNRNFIGIEKDETYFKIAQERINGTKPNPNNFEKVEERGLFSFTDE